MCRKSCHVSNNEIRKYTLSTLSGKRITGAQVTVVSLHIRTLPPLWELVIFTPVLAEIKKKIMSHFLMFDYTE
ncbi:hypothetical protein IscW_ISCW023782 [Ixodes scapularis]|uniref:Uncharacterized protein n=1 Tax=Ixodes scapularis TaxID=6945 RepID=B7QJV7_IXOSC|nr:hypothetical protein IscW_ISCW023782 [Ixodes scapularis]|eukprot:XP_002415464.1 hypothetical protein IscW_ISCW023782 [Ixodes scapularis]